MDRINLWIDRTTRDLELEKKIPNFKPLIRVKGYILFDGREEPEIAIVDTGAHISLIPLFIWDHLDVIWDHLDVEILAEHRMSGIVDISKEGEILGIEIIDAKGRLGVGVANKIAKKYAAAIRI